MSRRSLPYKFLLVFFSFPIESIKGAREGAAEVIRMARWWNRIGFPYIVCHLTHAGARFRLWIFYSAKMRTYSRKAKTDSKFIMEVDLSKRCWKFRIKEESEPTCSASHFIQTCTVKNLYSKSKLKFETTVVKLEHCELT